MFLSDLCIVSDFNEHYVQYRLVVKDCVRVCILGNKCLRKLAQDRGVSKS